MALQLISTNFRIETNGKNRQARAFWKPELFFGEFFCLKRNYRHFILFKLFFLSFCIKLEYYTMCVVDAPEWARLRRSHFTVRREGSLKLSTNFPLRDIKEAISWDRLWGGRTHTHTQKKECMDLKVYGIGEGTCEPTSVEKTDRNPLVPTLKKSSKGNESTR